MEINGKTILTSRDIERLFSVESSTVTRWYKEGLKHFKLGRNNYVFESDMISYLESLVK